MFASFIFEPIRACIFPFLETKAIAKANCFCIRPDAALIDKRFLCYQLASPRIGHALAAHVRGATRPRVNTTQLRVTSIAWCPLDEQREIVRRLDSALSRLDKVAAAQAAAIAELDRLDQALLARAFSGRLVPQSDSAPSRPTRPVIKPKSYPTQLVPALLRAHGYSLIHDGPREADLDAGLYRNLFSAARALEIAFGDREPTFQYIVTTTEPPPVELQTAPWLLDPVLDASSLDEKLLGENF